MRNVTFQTFVNLDVAIWLIFTNVMLAEAMSVLCWSHGFYENRCASSMILLFPSIGWMLMKVVNEGTAKPPNGMIMDTQVITCKRPLYPSWVSVRASYKCLLYLNHYRYGSQTRVATQSKVLHGRVIQCENQSRSIISLKVTSSLKTLNSSLTL